MSSVDSAIATIARSQHGLIARSQAHDSGITDAAIKRRVATSRLERLDVGVYRVAGTPPSWRQGLLAACLAAGPHAVVSHRAAAALRRFEGVAPGVVEVTAPRWLRRPRGIELHESTDLDLEDYDLVDGIPCTSPIRTMVDLGAVVSLEVLETALDDGLRRGLFSFDDVVLRRRQVARRGRNGVGPLRVLLAERSRGDAVAGSGFEPRLSRFLTDAGFERPVRQHQVFDGKAFVARLDLAYPAHRVGLEADSEAWHLDRQRFHADRTRRNKLEAIGWRILQFTYRHLRFEHDHICTTLERALAQQAKALEIA